jgi:hypothetical protein
MEVKINADVYAYYEHQYPIYRIWVNDTLYNEREFWTDCLSNYIEEEIYVDLEPGLHTLTLEKVTVHQAKVWFERVIVEHGTLKEILNFSTVPQDKQTIKFLINII